MLTDAELAAMRAVDETAMPLTCYISRMGTVSDGMGGFTEAWGNVGTVTCDLWQMNLRDNESISGAQILEESGWTITMPWDTSVSLLDRVTVQGRTFQVVRVNTAAGWRTALNVEARLHNEEMRT